MAPTYWDPEWLEFASKMGPPPPLPQGETEEKRSFLNNLLEQMPKQLPPPPEDVVSKDLQVPSGPAVRIYKPTDTEAQDLPLILFAHGGGWFAGNLETEDRSCRIICGRVRAWVVSVDYGCNFDVPLEHMIDDLHAAFEWSRGRAVGHGADPDKMVIWGGSAGGALAIALTHRLIREGRKAEVAGLVLMCSAALYPTATPAQYKHLMKSYEENDGPLPMITEKDARSIFEYRGLVPPHTDIALFPAAGGPEALTGFPATYAITADNDPVRDDMTVLVAGLNDAGALVKRESIPGVAHYFWTFDLPRLNATFWDKLVGGFQWVLQG